MQKSSPLETVYLNHSISRLTRLRNDQQTHAQSLISYMRGSAFGSAALETPFSTKIEFHPCIESPQSATVNIGKVRLTVLREANRILVSAKGR